MAENWGTRKWPNVLATWFDVDTTIAQNEKIFEGTSKLFKLQMSVYLLVHVCIIRYNITSKKTFDKAP